MRGPGSARPNVSRVTTRKERYERGRDLRRACPRSSHAEWRERDPSVDPVTLIEQSNVGRIPGLIPVRNARMAQSSFAFFRGSAILQAHDLLDTPVSGVNVQLCGDCHLMNFGGFATPERNLIFDVNDFDETFPGPWEWDVKRLSVSCVLAARDRGFGAGVARDAARAAVAAYRVTLREFARLSPLDVWYTHIPLRDAERFARGRTSESIFPKLTPPRAGDARIVDDPPLVYHFHHYVEQWDVTIRSFFERYRHSLPEDRRTLFDRYRFEDIAVKVVGIGSVGTRCTIALFVADDTDPLLLQAKEARRSVLEPPAATSRFKHQGERVVHGQRLMQAASDIFLGWAEVEGADDYYVRQLRDMKVSVDIGSLRARSLEDYASVCGCALARAHAKAGDAATIAGYIGAGHAFDRAIVRYACAYADQVEKDYATFEDAIRSGRISTEIGDIAEPEFLP
jgi:uncharacterized protein (DUF2252 family)